MNGKGGYKHIRGEPPTHAYIGELSHAAHSFTGCNMERGETYDHGREELATEPCATAGCHTLLNDSNLHIQFQPSFCNPTRKQSPLGNNFISFCRSDVGHPAQSELAAQSGLS